MKRIVPEVLGLTGHSKKDRDLFRDAARLMQQCHELIQHNCCLFGKTKRAIEFLHELDAAAELLEKKSKQVGNGRKRKQG